MSYHTNNPICYFAETNFRDKRDRFEFDGAIENISRIALAGEKCVYYLSYKETKNQHFLKKKEHEFEITEEDRKRLDAVAQDRKKDKLYCHRCNGITKQKFLFEKVELAGPQEIVFFDKDGDRQANAWNIFGRVWKISECQGCEQVNLNVFVRQSPFDYDQLIHHFPPKSFRPFPMWITYLNKEYAEILSEIYMSLNIGNKRIPIMGARTLLDMFILEKVGDIGTFKAKLKKLVEKNYITETSRKLLEVALAYGNATIHRGYTPNEEEINDVLDIIENFLYTEALAIKTTKSKKEVLARKTSNKKL